MSNTCHPAQPRWMAAIALSLVTATAAASYTTDTAAAGATLVDSLLAPSSGITVDAGSIVTIGAARQNGRVLSFDVPQRPLGPGVGLSTGTIRSVIEPNHGNSIATGSGAHAGISAARGEPTFDQGVLRFSFQVKAGMGFVLGLMLFGSDEYPTYLADPAYGDGLVILVDGVDVARIDGQAFSLATVNQHFGVDPDPDGVGKTGWNGLTPLLRFTAALDPLRSVHQVEFAIADVGDFTDDSALLLSSFQGLEPGSAIAGLALAMPEPATWALMLGGLAAVVGQARRRQRPRPDQRSDADGRRSARFGRWKAAARAGGARAWQRSAAFGHQWPGAAPPRSALARRACKEVDR